MGFLDNIGKFFSGIWNNSGADKAFHQAIGAPQSQDFSRGQLAGGSLAYSSNGGYSPSTLNYSVNPNAGQPSGSNGGNNGGGGQPNQPSQPNQPNQTQSTQDQYNNYMQGLRNTYDERAKQLQDSLGSLDTQKNSILDQIGNTYGNVIQGAKDTLSKNLGLLDSAKGDVTTGYDNQKTEQARLLGDTQRRNRQVARALGDSGSYYENLQSDAASNTAQNISTFSQKEQQQLDNIAGEITGEQTDTNTKIQNLNSLEAQAKTDVQNKFADEYTKIQDSLNFNEKDKQTALQGALGNEQSALDNITYLMGQYKADAAAAASAGAGSSDVLKYLTGKQGLIPQLSAIDTASKPIQNNQVLQQAIDSINSNGSQDNYNNIVGYLNLYDSTNGTNLSSILPNLLKQKPSSGFFGLGAQNAQAMPGLNFQTSSPILDLIQNSIGTQQ